MRNSEAITQKIPTNLAVLKAARHLYKEAVETERRLYFLLMDKVHIYQQNEGCKSNICLFQEWKAAMRTKTELSSCYTELAKSILVREFRPVL